MGTHRKRSTNLVARIRTRSLNWLTAVSLEPLFVYPRTAMLTVLNPTDDWHIARDFDNRNSERTEHLSLLKITTDHTRRELRRLLFRFLGIVDFRSLFFA